MSKEQVYIPMTGVDMLHYAKVITDTTMAYAADTPIRVPGTTEIGFNINAQTGTFHADNGPYATATALGEMDGAVACADVPPKMRSDLYGFDYDEKTGEMTASDINSPDMAFLYRIQKSNGAYRYVCIYKAKAAPNEERVQTKGGSINFQTNGFALKAAKRFQDGRFYRILDDDDPNLPEGVTPELIAEKWFSEVDWKISAEA